MKNQINKASNFASRDKNSMYANVLIKDAKVQCQDGMAGISIDIDTDLSFCCNAEKLKTILSNCNESDLKITVGKKLNIKSGNFKSSIKLAEIESYPAVTNNSEMKDIASIIPDMKMLSKFTDPTDVRLFVHGVYLTKDGMSATNGHVAVKKTIALDVESGVIVPTKSIDKFSALKEDINSIAIENQSIYFGFDGGFVFSKTIDTKMPDISKFFCKVEDATLLSDIKQPIQQISSLCFDSRTVLIKDEIKTLDWESVISGFNYPECAFNVDYMLDIIDIADIIDLSKYPDACPFEGDNIQGIISGIRI